MPAQAVAKLEHGAPKRDWQLMVVPAAALGWLAMILILVVKDQIALMPPRPPTPAETAKARPAAEAHWRRVCVEIQQRQEPWQPRPPELGAVWSTRTGDICGLVDRWRTGLDYMTRFYTLGDRLHFRDDDLRLYVRSWSKCMMDPWVVLHPGSDAEGLCASEAGRRDWARLCTTHRSPLTASVLKITRPFNKSRKQENAVNVFASVFSGAAPPQKAALLLLIVAVAAGLAGLATSLSRHTLPTAWKRTLGELRTAAPSLGLLVAGLDGLHMASTILKLPFNPTLKDLAPGIQEVTAFLALGAFAGLTATVALLAYRREGRHSQRKRQP